MATTPKQGWPIPDPTDLRGNVPTYMQNLGTAIEKQSVMRYATTTTRDASITAPEEGMVVYLTTPNQITVYDGAAWLTFDLTAQTYTPTLTQSNAVPKTVAQSSSSYARYWQHGKRVEVLMHLAVTGAGTASNEILIGLPITAAAGQANGGVLPGFGLVSSAGGLYRGLPQLASTTTLRLLYPATTTANGLGANTLTSALANTDIVRAAFVYEVA